MKGCAGDPRSVVRAGRGASPGVFKLESLSLPVFPDRGLRKRRPG
jgi:hypothetical protein